MSSHRPNPHLRKCLISFELTYCMERVPPAVRMPLSVCVTLGRETMPLSDDCSAFASRALGTACVVAVCGCRHSARAVSFKRALTSSSGVSAEVRAPESVRMSSDLALRGRRDNKRSRPSQLSSCS
eukprot:6172809-Pleurochrysis_carterae.AAC.3